MDNLVINESINKLFNSPQNNYIFIYSPPKVGSTTLVTSLRISLDTTYSIVHIHDEIMLNVLTGITGVKINDIIRFLSDKGKEVYVIDVYRTPIERKMSEFFEKISPYHFNNNAENISNYSLKRISDRFNKVFPHIENGDHYFEKYDISEPIHFDFEKKYTIQEINNVKYIKLRLCDSNEWDKILSTIFKQEIIIINDHQTENKAIGELYKKFKNEYKLPVNYFELIKKDKYLNFYYNDSEKNIYLSNWDKRLCENFTPYSENEYRFYMNLCLENQYINDINTHHYIDNGCLCKLCIKKRRDIFLQAKNGEKNFEKIIHQEVINDSVNKINNKLRDLISKKKSQQKYSPKQFNINII